MTRDIQLDAGGAPAVPGKNAGVAPAVPGKNAGEASAVPGKVMNNKHERAMKYICDICGYVYDPEIGDPDSGIEAGTAFEDIPAEWHCPECEVSKYYFSEE